MSLHPLVELSLGGEVRKAAGFKAAAAALNGEGLASQYQAEIANAPSRHGAGKKYLVAYNSRLASARKPARDSEHLCLALVDHCRREGAGLALPDEAGDVHFVHAHLPVKSAQEDKARGAEDPNRGLLPIDLLGIGPEERMVLARVKFVAPEATRAGTGETPLRALLEGLASAAIATANRADLGQEVAERVGRSFSDQPPLLLILGSPRYWELCRKREAQKGAAWINQMERLQREIEEQLGVRVVYAGLELPAAPAWSDDEDGWPALGEPPRLQPAWDEFAGRVKPKPRPRPKSRPQPTEVIVEADPSRPVRSYAMTDSYTAGDRVEHPRFGVGVVQGVVGPGKIKIRFEGEPRVLVHERAPRPA